VASGSGEAYALIDPCEGSITCATPARLDRSPIGQDAWMKFTTTKFSRGQADLVVEGTTVFVFTQAVATTPATLSSSVNGGAFTSLPVPCPSAMSASSFAANSPTEVALSCLGTAAAGGTTKAVYVSGNGGQTFTALAAPPENGSTALLAYPSASTVVLAANGNPSTLFQFAAGQPWAAKLSLSDGALGISDLAFVDAGHGYLVDGAAKLSLRLFASVRRGSPLGDVFATADGGASWRPLSLGR
jgi:hypothetical protein